MQVKVLIRHRKHDREFKIIKWHYNVLKRCKELYLSTFYYFNLFHFFYFQKPNNTISFAIIKIRASLLDFLIRFIDSRNDDNTLRFKISLSAHLSLIFIN